MKKTPVYDHATRKMWPTFLLTSMSGAILERFVTRWNSSKKLDLKINHTQQTSSYPKRSFPDMHFVGCRFACVGLVTGFMPLWLDLTLAGPLIEPSSSNTGAVVVAEISQVQIDILGALHKNDYKKYYIGIFFLSILINLFLAN